MGGFEDGGFVRDLYFKEKPDYYVVRDHVASVGLSVLGKDQSDVKKYVGVIKNAAGGILANNSGVFRKLSKEELADSLLMDMSIDMLDGDLKNNTDSLSEKSAKLAKISGEIISAMQATVEKYKLVKHQGRQV